ncbi:MAG TPA: hypothetical protein VK009_20175 [Chloroflexota bacterium]|nr:hypothetical protein [Chloroflexota bacterium]
MSGKRLLLALLACLTLASCARGDQPNAADLAERGQRPPSEEGPNPSGGGPVAFQATPLPVRSVFDQVPPAPTPTAFPNPPATITAPSEVVGPPAGKGRCATGERDLKLLVLSGDGQEVDLPAIRQALDYWRIPYDEWTATEKRGQLKPDVLADSCHGKYEGFILTDSTLDLLLPDGNVASALSAAEWQALDAYEADFGVRQVNWYGFPGADRGFTGTVSTVDTTQTPLSGHLTDAGKAAFPYLRPDAVLPFKNARAYLAKPADTGSTPLVVDGAGNALALVHSADDGRQELSLTVATNANLLHDMLLAYGLVNWAAQGLFIGERRAYLEPHIDDVLIADALFTGGSYRINAADLQALINWQNRFRGRPNSHAFKLEMAFNGYGGAGNYNPDDLTPALIAAAGNFAWVSHTYSHLFTGKMEYAKAREEIQRNETFAQDAHLPNYSPLSLVTPEVSGLDNPQFIKAAYDEGNRYLVSDTSKPEYNNPAPNIGLLSQFNSAIVLLPRHPTALYFDVSTPEQWVTEYNSTYRETIGHDVTYPEILDRESQTLLAYLLRGDSDSLMFHQTDLRAYDSEHSLLGDLFDRTLDLYDSWFTLPILTPPMDELGRITANYMQVQQAQVSGSVVPGSHLTLTAKAPAHVPVTGLCGSHSEVYGGQCITYVDVTPDSPATIRLS